MPSVANRSIKIWKTVRCGSDDWHTPSAVAFATTLHLEDLLDWKKLSFNQMSELHSSRWKLLIGYRNCLKQHISTISWTFSRFCAGLPFLWWPLLCGNFPCKITNHDEPPLLGRHLQFALIAQTLNWPSLHWCYKLFISGPPGSWYQTSRPKEYNK